MRTQMDKTETNFHFPFTQTHLANDIKRAIFKDTWQSITLAYTTARVTTLSTHRVLNLDTFACMLTSTENWTSLCILIWKMKPWTYSCMLILKRKLDMLMHVYAPFDTSVKIPLFQTTKKLFTVFHEDKTLLRWQANKLMSFYLRLLSPLPLVLNGDVLTMRKLKPNSDTLISPLYAPKAHVKINMQVHVSSWNLIMHDSCF